MVQQQLSVSGLAERMGTGRSAVRRILDSKNTSITLRTMVRAAKAAGLKIQLVAEPMSPRELGAMARRLARSKSRAESAELTGQITRGFYAES